MDYQDNTQKATRQFAQLPGLFIVLKEIGFSSER
jgi:hypothetical protein